MIDRQPLLDVRNISVGYGPCLVLRNVSLQARRGEIVGLLGPNGSGKSTLLKGITKLLPLAAGDVLVKGENVAHVSRDRLARTVAFVPQAPVLPPAFQVLDIVLMGRTPHLGLLAGEGARDLKAATQAMEVTGTLNLCSRDVGDLSGGEAQRVTIARALAQEPELMLLDEPTTHLDISYQVEIMELLRELSRDHGLGAVVTLHDLNLAGQFCDRLVLIGGGGIQAEGTPSEVITRENLRRVFGTDLYIFPHPVNKLPATLFMPGEEHGNGEAIGTANGHTQRERAHIGR